jgi:predicted dehydrogenase
MQRLLVVGCGSIGERHIRCLGSCQDVEVTPCDPRDERLEQMLALYGTRPGIADYADADLDEFDAVLICTPSNMHIPQAMRACRHGCHLFVEKPMSVDMAGVDALIEAAAERELVLQVGYMLRHHPLLASAQKLVQQGAIGTVYMADICCGAFIGDARPEYAQLYWAKRASGGGVLYDASHELDLIQWFLGPVAEVSCMARHFKLEVDADVDDGAVLIMRTESGALVNMFCNDIQRNYKRAGQIIGDKGTVEYSYDESRFSLYQGDTGTWIHQSKQFERDDFYINQMQNFCAAIRGEEEPRVNGEDGKRSLALALAGYLSAAEKRFVQIAEVLA